MGREIWWLGPLLSALGSTMSNFGVNCQKLSAMWEAKVAPEERRPYTRQPMWWVGILLLMLGSFGDFSALMFSPQSIVAPVSAITLVANIFFATSFLGEQVQNTDYVGTGCILVGVLICVVFGSRGHDEIDITDMKSNFVQAPFLVYAIITSSSALAIYLCCRYLEPKRVKLETLLFEGENVWLKEIQESNAERIECTNWKNSLIRSYHGYVKFVKLHPFFYCALSGILGGQSLTFAKSVGELIGDSFDQGWKKSVGSGIFWFFFFGMLFFIFSQIHFINKALIISDALFVVPVFQCFWISFSTLGGLFYYQEYKTLKFMNYLLFPIGIILILLGVYTLALREFLIDIISLFKKIGIDIDSVNVVSPSPRKTTDFNISVTSDTQRDRLKDSLSINSPSQDAYSVEPIPYQVSDASSKVTTPRGSDLTTPDDFLQNLDNTLYGLPPIPGRSRSQSRQSEISDGEHTYVDTLQTAMTSAGLFVFPGSYKIVDSIEQRVEGGPDRSPFIPSPELRVVPSPQFSFVPEPILTPGSHRGLRSVVAHNSRQLLNPSTLSSLADDIREDLSAASHSSDIEVYKFPQIEPKSRDIKSIFMFLLSAVDICFDIYVLVLYWHEANFFASWAMALSIAIPGLASLVFRIYHRQALSFFCFFHIAGFYVVEEFYLLFWHSFNEKYVNLFYYHRMFEFLGQASLSGGFQLYALLSASQSARWRAYTITSLALSCASLGTGVAHAVSNGVGSIDAVEFVLFANHWGHWITTALLIPCDLVIRVSSLYLFFSLDEIPTMRFRYNTALGLCILFFFEYVLYFIFGRQKFKFHPTRLLTVPMYAWSGALSFVLFPEIRFVESYIRFLLNFVFCLVRFTLHWDPTWCALLSGAAIVYAMCSLYLYWNRELTDDTEIDVVNDWHQSPLMSACQNNQMHNVRLLTQTKRVNLEQQDSFGWTALLYAAQYGRTECVEILIKAGARVDHTSRDGKTALMLACVMNRQETVSLLLDCSASINLQDKRGFTALMFAAYYGYDEIVTLLLQYDANMFIYNIARWTALRFAAASGNVGCVKLLLDSVPTEQAEYNRLREDLCRHVRQVNCLKLIEDHKAKRDDYAKTDKEFRGRTNLQTGIVTRERAASDISVALSRDQMATTI